MAKYLVIVESPAKVKTVKKYLGANYEVAASMGHVRDLPKSRLGIDVEHDFEPKYITIRGKGELLASLRKAAKKADKVYLATDPDREGEAISWHLSIALNLDENKMRRITFNEITKSAVKASIKQARDIDMNLVDEQQARRCLDRMVGYEISPLLWKKIKRGLSAGRVQSVALRIIGDREDEINAFIPKEYWTLEADLKIPGEKKPLVAKFHGKGSEKMAVETKEQLDEILKGLENETFTVSEVKKGERMRKNPLKMLWLAAAFLCLGIGAVGVILPILPTTPFLLVASFCFARGSERFHKWFMGTKLYKNHLDSFVKERAMTLKTKLCILLPASAMLMCAFFMMSNLPGRIFILLLILFKYVYFFTKIKTIRIEAA